MKIALIGATGFVASAILKEGLQRGHEVPAIVRHTERLTSYSGTVSRWVIDERQIQPGSLHHALKGGSIMDWEAPSFVEVKMDAEINSYQDDFADIPDIKKPSAEGSVMTTPQ
jgi:hypothetical protein